MATDILALVAAYVDAVRSAVRALEVQLGTTALLGAVRVDRRRREGSLNANTNYSFHGVGCRVTRGETTLDFDFGPGGRVGGFDAWRLALFAGGDSRRFAGWSDSDRVTLALRSLEADGLIEAPRLEPSPHLHYLTPAGEIAIAAITIGDRRA